MSDGSQTNGTRSGTKMHMRGASNILSGNKRYIIHSPAYTNRYTDDIMMFFFAGSSLAAA
jgi:hypothetical protein